MNISENPAQRVSYPIVQVLTTLDGLYYLSELALSIIDMVGEFFKKIPHSLTKFNAALYGYIGISSTFDFIGHLYHFIFQREKLLKLADKVQQILSFIVDLTKSICDFIYMLEDFEFFKLLKKIPLIDQLLSALNLVSTSLSVWGACQRLQDGKAIKRKITLKTHDWNSLEHTENWSDFIQNKLDHWQNVSIKKFNKWSIIQQKITTKEAFQQFCRQKVNYWNLKKANVFIKRNKTIFELACLVVYAVSIVFSFIVCPPLAIPLLAFSIAVNTSYCVQTILDFIYKEKPLPTIDL